MLNPIIPTLAVLAPWQHTLLDWIGVDFSRSPENAEAELLWTNLPASWGVLEGCPELDPDAAWNQVIQDVDQVTFFYGDPTFFFIFQAWSTGIDNPSITRALP